MSEVVRHRLACSAPSWPSSCAGAVEVWRRFWLVARMCYQEVAHGGSASHYRQVKESAVFRRIECLLHRRKSGRFSAQPSCGRDKQDQHDNCAGDKHDSDLRIGQALRGGNKGRVYIARRGPESENSPYFIP